MSKKIVFIKCGGSFITHKDKPYTPRPEVMKLFATQLKQAITHNPDTQVILGNGAGSYGHYAVMEHDIKNQTHQADLRLGISHVHHSVATLHQMVMTILLDHSLPVFSLQPSAILSTHTGSISHVSLDSFMNLLHGQYIPCVYGDIVFDTQRGYHIASTETIFDVLIDSLMKKQEKIDRIIYLTTVPGVLDTDGAVISEITPRNVSDIITDQSEGYDVTGGMKHKIERALSLAKKGIPSYIGTLTETNTLRSILSNEHSQGTQIKQ